jgi:hypothetical protein
MNAQAPMPPQVMNRLAEIRRLVNAARTGRFVASGSAGACFQPEHSGSGQVADLTVLDTQETR